jgi:hypothetical protein
MPAKLNWVEILNEQATWQVYDDLIAWASLQVGRPISLPEQAVEAFNETLNFMRRQLSALHFGEALDLGYLNEELAQVEVELVGPAGTDQKKLSGLPAFRARPSGRDDAAVLRCIEHTLLLQFAEFVGTCLDDPDENRIARCEGLYRESRSRHLAPVPSFPADIELRWRKELPVLAESGLESDPEIKRCADFFVVKAKGRFCSDECRFRTFQIAKQLKEPGYLAEKQKRYRQRREK